MAAADSSSAPTLWATASKEWVIQPKPKPGRKPKKDILPPSKTETEAEAKGRRIQNRAAQRAFRERKQSQLSELQARIQLYEQGEIERNVALQNIAKRLKEENEKLREENQALHARILQMQQQVEAVQSTIQCESSVTDRKRWRDESPGTMSLQASMHKKQRKDSDTTRPPQLMTQALHLPSPTSTIVSTPEPPDTVDSDFGSISYDLQHDIHAPDLSHFSSLSEVKSSESALSSFPPFGCGFCDERTICVCREIAVQQVTDPIGLKTTTFDEPQMLVDRNDETVVQPSVQAARPSILDKLPEYQPPVALRKRPERAQVNSVFRVEAAPGADRVLDANCSGDPSNCLACGDDPFGKAFCSEMEKSASRYSVCDDCPQSDATSGENRCCSANGPGCATCPSSSVNSGASSSQENSELMPTDDAWRRLKAHPNVEFADLSLLAEVVSSRSKCLGPRITVSPAPQNSFTGRISDNPGRGGATSPPRLVPQEVLLECGRRRLRQVHADGVREALRLLDAKFT